MMDEWKYPGWGEVEIFNITHTFEWLEKPSQTLGVKGLGRFFVWPICQ
ncbi:hypothetical protein [Cytobacillus oceanisediminis]|nr:hypothetical protein [Cytobacillus oceanisediminis]MDK7668685.1 hypothetical protein [Cytobacillus oceanisediminis]